MSCIKSYAFHVFLLSYIIHTPFILGFLLLYKIFLYRNNLIMNILGSEKLVPGSNIGIKFKSATRQVPGAEIFSQVNN